MKENKKHNIKNRIFQLLKGYKKSITIITLVAIFIVTILLMLDIFNVPTKLGFNINAINFDFWSIILSNVVVIVIFIITFILFDKRNLEKDHLGKFAGVIALKNTYKEVNLLIGMIEKYIKKLDEREENATKKDYTFIDFLDRKYPFENDEMIFELLQNGNISKVRYQNYYDIKGLYHAVTLSITEFPKSTDMAKAFFDKLKEIIEPEIEALNEYEESL